MTSFSSYFELNLSQAQLDFVDIEIDKDTRLYVDPYALSIQEDDWSMNCTDHVVSYFQTIIDCIKAGDDRRGKFLMNNLSEPNETCFGLSKGLPRGRSVGVRQSADIYGSLKRSEAAQTGELKDLSDTTLFVEGIGPDKISDITTNVIRLPLMEYTKQQCILHGVPLNPKTAMPAFWNKDDRRWQAMHYDIPLVDGRPILLVPKTAVRRYVGMDSQEFYNKHMLTILQAEHLEANSSLVETLKNGKLRVTKKVLKEKYPNAKDDIFNFVRSHPRILELYKGIKGAEGSLSMEDFAADFNYREFCDGLIAQLLKIPRGNNGATEYHRFCVGLLTFLFHPDLTIPEVENEIHEGRKRIDIVYINSADKRFFYRMRTNPQTQANQVMVECKNYSSDIANNALDQLSSRFSPNRGRFGILLCRELRNKEQFIKRCKDTAADNRGFILPLDDDDIIGLLRKLGDKNSLAVNRFLEGRYAKLIN